MHESMKWRDWKTAEVAISFPENEYQVIHETQSVEGHEIFGYGTEFGFLSFVFSGLDKVVSRTVDYYDSLPREGDQKWAAIIDQKFRLPNLTDAGFISFEDLSRAKSAERLSTFGSIGQRVVGFRFSDEGSRTVGAISQLTGESVNDIMRSAGYEAVMAVRSSSDWADKCDAYEDYQKLKSLELRQRLGRSDD